MPRTADATRLVEMEMAAATRLGLSRSDAENRDMETRLRATNAAKGDDQCHPDDASGSFKTSDETDAASPARHARSVPLFIDTTARSNAPSIASRSRAGALPGSISSVFFTAPFGSARTRPTPRWPSTSGGKTDG